MDPLRIDVNGRRGRRAVCVLYSDRQWYSVLDMDSLDDTAEPETYEEDEEEEVEEDAGSRNDEADDDDVMSE